MVAVGDAAMGAAFGEALKLAINVLLKSIKFKTTLKSFERRMDSLSKSTRDIDMYDQQLDRTNENSETLNKHVKKGKKVVRKCATIKWWNCCCLRPYYAFEISKMEGEKAGFFQVEVQAGHVRDNKETLVTVIDIKEDVGFIAREIANVVSSQKNFVGCCSVPELRDKTFGFDAPLKEVKMQLLDDGVDVLVVSGPGGSGKTTLVTLLCHDDKVKDKFKEKIFFVHVNKKNSLKDIVRKMFEHNNFQLPDLEDEDDAANQLGHLLKKIGPNPMLVVLDDISSASKSVLDKFRFKLPGYKILATSRFVFPKPASTYHLQTLTDEDAIALFRNAAIWPDGKTYIPDESLVQEIVKGCKRLPLALNVVGKSLCGQPAESWKSLVMEWSQGCSIFDSDSFVLNCLKSSLDILDSDKKVVAKECFLDLGSFPEGQSIPATALIDLWTELYGLGADALTAMNNIYELSNRNLVNLVITREDANDVEGCYSGHFVSQHDLLRELAIYLTQCNSVPVSQRKRLFIELSGDNLESLPTDQQPTNARLLSITTDETINPNLPDMKVPEVEALILNLRTKAFVLPGFIKTMDKLKVLIITSYGSAVAEVKEFPILCDLPNLKRIRLERISVPPLTKSAVQMKKLEKLSLTMCKIDQAFRYHTVGISDVLPNVVEIGIDYCYDLEELPEELCDIVCLKKLSITNCHKLSVLPERIGDLVNMDELRLHSCTGLRKLPATIGCLQKLSFLDISNCLSIKRLPNEIGSMRSMRKLHMRGCSGLLELPETVSNLEHLENVICDQETAQMWELMKPYFTNLNIKVPEEDINLNWLHISS